MTPYLRAAVAASVVFSFVPSSPALMAGASAADRQGPGRGAAPDATRPQRLEIAEGTTARYRVREQLAGISFPSDAIGTTQSVSGAIILNPDGSIAPESKLTVDMASITSDQSMRDGYIQGRVLETERFPTLELVPKRVVGLPMPLPAGMGAQAGFQLVTDMTIRDVTREVTWNVVATFGNDQVAGHATTTFQFATFDLEKPTLARLLSVADDIQLEIEFRCTRNAA